MTQLKRSAIALGLLIGLSACTPTNTPSVERSDSDASSSSVPPANAPAESSSENANASDTSADISPVEAPPTASPADASGADTPTDISPTPSNTASVDKPIENALVSEPWPEGLSEAKCSNPVTQIEMNLCAQARQQQADAQLAQTTQTLKSELTISGQQALSTAELAWINYRDLDCDFARSQYAGGTISPLIYSTCLESHTQQRNAELSQALLPQTSYQSADTQLNDAYQQLLAVLDDAEKETITDTQLAWIDYRDRHCAFEVLYSPDVIEESQCLARMSETRTVLIEQTTDQRSL